MKHTQIYYEVQTEDGGTFTDGRGDYNHDGLKKCHARIAELRRPKGTEYDGYGDSIVLNIVKITITSEVI